jgi:hypothetical protein
VDPSPPAIVDDEGIQELKVCHDDMVQKEEFYAKYDLVNRLK